MSILVEYRSNNSGGSWWLDEKDWQALKEAGWKPFGYGDYAYKDGGYIYGSDGLPLYKSEALEQDEDKFPPLPKLYDTQTSAFKMFDSIKDAIREFEKLTGQDVSDEGCNCCGAPHSFRWSKQSASGDELLKYMYDSETAGLSKRELLERADK